jgi:2'-5' RNA ligase
MRLFFAIEIPAEVRAGLAAVVERLRPRAPEVRWVRPEGIHLTLRFLGEVGEARLGEIVAAARRVGSGGPLRLRTGGLGSFPDRGRPRVVWVGVEERGAALRRLREDLEAALGRIGFPPEERGWSPHLTLGRVRPGGDPRPALAAASAPEAREFEAREFVLMESCLDPAGARYERRAAFPLGCGAEAGGAEGSRP